MRVVYRFRELVTRQCHWSQFWTAVRGTMQLNQTTMPADADVVEHRRINGPVTTYCDVRINSSEECRLAFMKRLYEGGLLGFSRNPI